MPSKKQTRRFIKTFAFVMAAGAALFIAYILFLWLRGGRGDFVMYKEFGIPIPTNYAIHGIDVSRYQERISWEAVQKMEVDYIKLGFVFIKATEGTGRTDPYFRRNWERSKGAGLVRGAYHFFIASRDGTEQAKNFCKAVKLESGDLPPVLDVEKTFGIAPALIRKEVKKWCTYIEGYYGVKPILYTNADFYTNHLQGYLDEVAPGLTMLKETWIQDCFGALDLLCCRGSLSDDVVTSAHDHFFLVLVEEKSGWRVTSVSRAPPPACRDDGD
jgi:lysozyme